MDVKITENISAYCDQVRRELQQLPQEAFEYYRSITPIRSGNARRRTQLRGTTIQPQYAYAERLDQGWSRQAPQGMTQPTQAFIDRRVRTIMEK